MISKSSTRPDQIKQQQQQHQEEVSQLDDSSSDQQWHTVSSNKEQRKGSATTIAPRQGSNDESQDTNNIVKTLPTNPGKYCFMYVKSLCDASFNHELHLYLSMLSLLLLSDVVCLLF